MHALRSTFALPLLLGAAGCGSLLGIEELKDDASGRAGASGSTSAGTGGSDAGAAGSGVAGTGTAGTSTAGAGGSEVAGAGGSAGTAGSAGSAGGATCMEGETSCFDATSQKVCQNGMLKVTPCVATNPCLKAACEGSTGKCADGGPVMDGQTCTGGTCKGGVCSPTSTCTCPNGSAWTGMPCPYEQGTTASNGAGDAINGSMGGLVQVNPGFSTEISLPTPFTAKAMLIVWLAMPGVSCTFTAKSGPNQLGMSTLSAQQGPNMSNLQFQGTPMAFGQYALIVSCTGSAQLDEVSLVPPCAM